MKPMGFGVKRRAWTYLCIHMISYTIYLSFKDKPPFTLFSGLICLSNLSLQAPWAAPGLLATSQATGRAVRSHTPRRRGPSALASCATRNSRRALRFLCTAARVCSTARPGCHGISTSTPVRDGPLRARSFKPTSRCVHLLLRTGGGALLGMQGHHSSACSLVVIFSWFVGVLKRWLTVSPCVLRGLRLWVVTHYGM